MSSPIMNKESYFYRYAISVGLTVFVAVLVSHYFSYSGEAWMVLAAFLVGQTSRGAPIRQGLLLAIIVVAAVLVSTLLVNEINHTVIIYVMLALIFVVGTYIAFLARPLTNKALFLTILFPLVVLIATLSPINMSHLMYDRLMDTLIGCMLGILFAHFILPVQAFQEFSRGLIPQFQALKNYSLSVEDYFLQHHTDVANGPSNMPIIQADHYPEWVYEVGFNPGLRSGFRFFLITIERITEILYSMNYLSSCKVESSLLQAIEKPLSHAMHKNNELLSILKEFFERKKLNEIVSDYTTDITTLEFDLKQIIPGKLELLDIKPDYLTLVAFVRNVKDMRELLLQLVLALPGNLNSEV